ncbi:MAG: hypothetical protein LUD02_01010 [Tannerellaceae bacterium]|nr:hypothetical protein [Tannerellaceae bacterium]
MVTEKVMVADPRRIGEIKIDFYFSGNIGEKERKMLRRVAETCPVGKSLHPDLKQTINFYFDI